MTIIFYLIINIQSKNW